MDKLQGGIFELPIPRFSNRSDARQVSILGDEQCYLVRLSAWGSTQRTIGGLYRIRRVDHRHGHSIGIKATTTGNRAKLSDELDRQASIKICELHRRDLGSFTIQKYGIQKTTMKKFLKVTQS